MERKLRIAYLVHNLADPAVRKRIRMLSVLGDSVLPIGFHRDEQAIEQIEKIGAVDLGRTYDANLMHRALMVAKRSFGRRSWARQINDCDVVLARNLEMLVIAAMARRKYAPRAHLAYECLDIHRFLLSDGVCGIGMRALERRLLRTTELLIVSSPAFLREYFEPRQHLDRRRLPVLTVENKVFLSTVDVPAMARMPSLLPPGPPWRIGWFGMIRCRKSLDVLCHLATRHPGLVEVMIRGRPSRTEFEDFDGQIARTPGVSFGGTYRPAELAELYGSVHFNWTLDFFEEGANSRWLLPNRIYEGGIYDAVPIALTGTETAGWLDRLGTGLFIRSLADLDTILPSLTPERYRALKEACRAAPRSAFISDDRDCARLLDALGGMGTAAPPESRRSPSVAADLR